MQERRRRSGISSSIAIDTSTGTAKIDGLKGPTQKIIGAIQIVGYLIAAGMIVYIGVKYIMASASEKADLKGLAIKYVIGAILIVFGTTIASWIFSINGGSSASGGGPSTISQSGVNSQTSQAVR